MKVSQDESLQERRTKRDKSFKTSLRVVCDYCPFP